ncbi:tetratricopeptide repeat protein [Maricaulis sp. CAU 1757]
MTDAPQLNLTAEIAADAEPVQNAAHDAAGTDQLKVKIGLGAIPKDKRRAYQKVIAIAKKAMKASAAQDHTEAAKLAYKTVEMAPDLALSHHLMGLMLYNLGRLSKALEFLETAWKLDPKDAEVYQKLGLVAWKLDMLEAAEKFYRIELQLAPTSIAGTINLAGVLRDQGKFEQATELLRTAIYANPENYELWNSLGVVLNDADKSEEAVTFFEEALRLNPGYGRAHNNMANVYEMTNEPGKALEHYEHALKDPADEMEEATMRHSRSLLLLADGQIGAGWDAAESRLDANRKDATLFSIRAPYWDGTEPEKLKGKTLLLVGEQGLGDEVLFMNTVPDLLEAVGPEGELRIACEYRLQALVKRSFPQAKVSHHASATIEGRQIRVAPQSDQGADYWTAMGTTPRAFRRSIEAFPNTPAFLTPDPELCKAFREQLDGFGPGLKVGLLWKSLKMDAKRSRYFSAFDAWEGVLRTPGCEFVNLQYGEVDEEIATARERFDVEIHQPRDIDLKMDLDKVAALGASCDLVIGPMNATTNLTAACGGEVWFVHARRTTWTLLGGDCQPWYPTSRSFMAKGARDWNVVMSMVQSELVKLVEAGSG